MIIDTRHKIGKENTQLQQQAINMYGAGDAKAQGRREASLLTKEGN
jgi:hypothetical protein